MKPWILPFTVLFVLHGLAGCSERNQTSLPRESKRQDSAFIFFEKSKEAEKINNKLKLLQLASAQIKKPNDTLLADILDYRIYYFHQKRNIDSALFYANALIDYGFTNSDTSSIAKGFYRKAKSYSYLNRQDKVLENIYNSQKYYLLSGDSLQAGRRMLELAIAQDRLGDFAGAQSSATRALDLLQVPDSLYLSSAYNVIASSSRHMGDPKEAMEEYHNALQYATKTLDSVIIYNNLALLHVSQNEYAQALKIFQNIIKKVPEGTTQWLLIMDNYFFTQWLNSGKDISDDLLNILELRKRKDDKQGLISSYDHFTQFYKDKDPGKAKKYARKYLKASQEAKDVAAQVDALEHLMELAEPKNSREYTRAYVSILDSVEKARNNIKNLFAKIKYDEETKIRQINELEKISALTELEATKQRTQKLLILMGLILVTSLAIFIYFHLKQRHKREKIKEIHSTEAKLSKKVHDELANDLFQIMTAIPEKNSGVLDKLESVYKRTRDISKENQVISLDDNFSEELLGMIHTTIPDQTKSIIKGFEKVAWYKLSEEQKIIVFRVLQELMVNFRKHSNASFLVLDFSEDKSGLKIHYRDNGRGTNLKDKKFSGLQNIQNRLQSIKGKVIFDSDISKGFRSEISVPY